MAVFQPALRSSETRRHPRILWSRWKARSHVAVWLVLTALAGLILIYGVRTGGMPGYVEIVEHPIASLELGRLQTLEVRVGDPVEAGQVVARFDPGVIDAQIQSARAVYEKLQGSVPTPDQTALQLQRQFAAAQSRISALLNEERIRQAQDAAELAVLEKELKRLEPLIEQRLVDMSAVNAVRTRHAVLSNSAALHPALLRGLEQDDAESRRQHGAAEEALQRFSVVRTNGWTNYEAVAQAMLVAGMEARRQEYVLRSPSRGMVSQVMFRPGDVVMAGTPIMVIVEQPPVRIVGFMPEISAHDARLNQPVQVERMYGLGMGYRATVSALEPAVRGLPGQVNPLPGRVIRGRRIYCNLAETTDLLPGETVQIKLVSPFWLQVRDAFVRLVSLR